MLLPREKGEKSNAIRIIAGHFKLRSHSCNPRKTDITPTDQTSTEVGVIPINKGQSIEDTNPRQQTPINPPHQSLIFINQCFPSLEIFGYNMLFVKVNRHIMNYIIHSIALFRG
jgi:hypothetical protein